MAIKVRVFMTSSGLVAWESCRMSHVVGKLVHPHVAVSLLALCDAEYLALIKAHHKYAEDEHAQQNADCDLGDSSSSFNDLLTE